MEATSPSFFLDLSQVLGDFAVLSACRITDPANTGSKNENFTVEFFLEGFAPASPTYVQLERLKSEMEPLRTKSLPARNKLVAHADREAIRKGKPLGFARWDDWEKFWSALKSFISLPNEKVLGSPFDIDVSGVSGDAEALMKALQQSQYFDTLLTKGDEVVQNACLKLALPS